MPTSANEAHAAGPTPPPTTGAEVSPPGSASGDPHAAAPHGGHRRHPREHFWNWPNTITVLRVGVVPVFLLLPLPLLQTKTGSAVVAWLFIAAAASDLLDGWLARRDQQVTRIGKLLDPLADKFIVSTALVMLVSIGRLEWYGAWMAVVIVGRELAVTGLRGIASTDGRVMAARGAGKLKTVFQNVAIAALLFHHPTLGLPAHEIGLAFLALATVLTLWSGYLYFADYFGWRDGPAPRPPQEDHA